MSETPIPELEHMQSEPLHDTFIGPHPFRHATIYVFRVINNIKTMRDAGVLFISTVAGHGHSWSSSAAAAKAPGLKVKGSKKASKGPVEPEDGESLEDSAIFPPSREEAAVAPAEQAMVHEGGEAMVVTPFLSPLSPPRLSTVVGLARLCSRKNMELGRVDLGRHLAAALVRKGNDGYCWL